MKQISVVADNKVGVLADISFILGRSKINIDSISLNSVGDKSVLTLGVKDDARAIQLLSANGYTVIAADLLVVKLPNKPGELAKMSKLLADENINLTNVMVISQDDDGSLYSIHVDKMAKANKLLAPYLKIED